MSELVLPDQNIAQNVSEYDQRLTRYIAYSNFPVGLLVDPDYAMIKAATPRDFGKMACEGQQMSEYTIFREVDWRFLVAARLLTPLALLDSKPVRWVEVMEAKSPDGTVDYLGAEYVSFFVQNFGNAENQLRARGVSYEFRTDGTQRWLQTSINENGQELRITDKYLEERVDQALELESARII